MEIIELCGKAGVGKDTFGQELIKQLEAQGKKCVHIAFADYLKFLCKQYFGWDGNKDEKGRELLQRMGTDVFRKTDENFWVNVVANLLRIYNINNLFDFAIITDARFPNEINGLRDALAGEENVDVKAYRIIRNNFVSRLSDEAQQHSSETALDNFALDEIVLSGNINNLPLEVKRFIENCLIY